MSTKKSIVGNSPKIKQLFPLGGMWESFHLHMVFYSYMDAVPALPLNMHHDYREQRPHRSHTFRRGFRFLSVMLWFCHCLELPD